MQLSKQWEFWFYSGISFSLKLWTIIKSVEKQIVRFCNLWNWISGICPENSELLYCLYQEQFLNHVSLQKEYNWESNVFSKEHLLLWYSSLLCFCTNSTLVTWISQLKSSEMLSCLRIISWQFPPEAYSALFVGLQLNNVVKKLDPQQANPKLVLSVSMSR